jgi:glycyl-tRNA synthetase
MLRTREHSDEERSHYSKKTVDVEYKYPAGYKEMYGIAYRTDFDLSNHAKQSGEDLRFNDQQTGEKFFPHVVEPAMGVDRTLLPMLFEAYTEEENRIVMKFKPMMAPYQAAVFPLVANKPELAKKAREVFESLVGQDIRTVWDDRGNIGKRYRAQDEIGTPYCLTIDYQSLEDNTVTIRNRDTMKQDRIKIDELGKIIKEKTELK